MANSDLMTANSQVMREAASEITSKLKEYQSLIDEIKNLVNSQLAMYWVDAAYDSVKTQFGKDEVTLNELKDILDTECVRGLNTAADDLDRMVREIQNKVG